MVTISWLADLRLEERVYERGDNASVAQDQQASHQEHRDQQRQQPELLADAQELPKLNYRGHGPLPRQNWFFIDDFRALSCSRGTQ